MCCRVHSLLIEAVNKVNSQLFEILGQKRDEVFFGDATRVCTVTAYDTQQPVPIAGAELVTISPYTEVQHVKGIIN